MDWKVLGMWTHPGGYHVARVLCYHSQQEVILHDRWGSWWVQDPEAERGSSAREPSALLAAALQGYKKSNTSKLEPYVSEKMKKNVFLAKSTRKKRAEEKKVNPFIKKAAKTNPLIRKLLEQGKIS